MSTTEISTLLAVEGLKVHFETPRGVVKAVDGLDFDIRPGETLGLVGESGCGKSTVARSIVGLVTPTAGQIVFEDEEMKGGYAHNHHVPTLRVDPDSR